MPIYRNGEFVPDDWAASPNEEPCANARKLFSKRDYLERRDEIAKDGALSLGLILESGETLEGLEEDISRFAIIILNIAKFNDGRLYSIARLLRERYAYEGELRAAGDILRDQLAFLYRAGVDSFDVSNPDAIHALRTKAVIAGRKHYQTASRERSEEKQRHSPRARLSEAGDLPGVKP